MKCIILSCRNLDFADERDPGRRVIGLNINYSVPLDQDKGYEVFKCFIPEKSIDYLTLKGKTYPAIGELTFKSVSRKGALVSVPINFRYIESIKIGV